jgi:Sec-independent protein secretion pathway component TatC
LGLVAFATLATPDWSPVTIGLLFACVVVLYESTMAVTRVAFAKRIKEQVAQMAEAS